MYGYQCCHLHNVAYQSISVLYLILFIIDSIPSGQHHRMNEKNNSTALWLNQKTNIITGCREGLRRSYWRKAGCSAYR